jgi:Ca2+-binding RTX toxin-like protein
MKLLIRMGTVLLLLVLQAPVLNGVAHAASTVRVVNSTLQFQAAAGKANAVTVSLNGARLIVEDRGDIVTPGQGCIRVPGDPNKVSCSAAGVTSMSIELGDKNDSARNLTDIRSSMIGASGDDVLSGGSGNDELIGRDGKDRLIGASGDDALFGSSGDDQLIGNNGQDQLDGGLGNDDLSASSGTTGSSATMETISLPAAPATIGCPARRLTGR